MIFGIILPWYIVIVSAWTVYYTTLLGSLALLLEFGWPGHCVFIHSGQESGQQISQRKDHPTNCTHLVVPTVVSVIAEEALRFLLPENRNVLVGPMAQRRRRDEGGQEHGRCWRRRGQGRRRARQDDATAGGPLRSLAPLHRRLQQAGE